MLLTSPRHTDEDLALWAMHAEADMVHGHGPRVRRLVESALDCIRDFARRAPCYAGVSWGKDSTVLADLVVAAEVDVPLIWVRVDPIESPECLLVRNAFRARFPEPRYCEYIEKCQGLHASRTLERGFARAAKDHGIHYFSGIRADESAHRLWRAKRYGRSSPRTCAPLSDWTSADIFGWLAIRDLPIHPAYACLGGGRWRRDKIRVASLGGKRGDGLGRSEWEREYYGGDLNRLVHQDLFGE